VPRGLRPGCLFGRTARRWLAAGRQARHAPSVDPAPRTPARARALLLGLCLVLGWMSGTPAAAESGNTSVGTGSAPLRALSLDDAYDRALATDQTVQIALAEVRKADLLPWSALTRIAPRLTADAAYTKPETTLPTPFGFPILAETEGASITVQQPLLDLTVFVAYRNGTLATQAARLAERFTARTELSSEKYDYQVALRALDLRAGVFQQQRVERADVAIKEVK
jgi:hypothetical protein